MEGDDLTVTVTDQYQIESRRCCVHSAARHSCDAAFWMVTGSGLAYVRLHDRKGLQPGPPHSSAYFRASAAKVLEGGDGILQIDRDALPDVAANAALYDSNKLVVVRPVVISSIRAGVGCAGAGAADVQRQIRPGKRQSKKVARQSGDQSRDRQTNLYPSRCVRCRMYPGLDGIATSFWRSFRMWLSTVRVGW